LIIEYVFRQQHLALATLERGQIQLCRTHPGAVLIQIGNIASRDKKISPTKSGDDTDHRWVIVGPIPDEDVAYRRDLAVSRVEYRLADHL
jgi:hypothetical protein